jgi:hypothetical protein
MSEWEGKPLSAADSWAGLQVKEQLLALAADAAVAAWDQGSPAAALGAVELLTALDFKGTGCLSFWIPVLSA